MIVLRYLSSSTLKKHFKEGTRGGRGSCQFSLECYQWWAHSLYYRYCMDEDIADAVTEATYVIRCGLPACGPLLGIITWVQMIKKNNTFCLILCLTGLLGRLYICLKSCFTSLWYIQPQSDYFMLKLWGWAQSLTPRCLQDPYGIPELQVGNTRKRKNGQTCRQSGFFGFQVANIRSLHLQRHCSPKLCKTVQMVSMSLSVSNSRGVFFSSVCCWVERSRWRSAVMLQ